MEKNTTPLVSIITVVYNGAKTLEQTIQSVINQSYKNIEYIIIDGGSTDGTLEIIKKYEKYITYWHSKSDKGLYDAMNIGIEISTGELIGMINSDDWYELNAVSTIINKYKESNSQIVHGDINLIKTNGDVVIRKFNPSNFKFVYYGMTYLHPTFFVTKYIYKRFKYNTALKTISDYQFTLQVFLENENNFEYVDDVISNFRSGGLSGELTLKQHLIDGYIARKNSKLNFVKNVFSVIIRFIMFYYKQGKR